LDLSKFIKQLFKIDAAGRILYKLAASPRRNWIVGIKLRVHQVPTPPKKPIHVNPDDTKKEWCPSTHDLPQIIEKMRKSADSPSTNGSFSIASEVHSECQLVAWIAQNVNTVAPDVKLIPYVTCSKLHCFACYIWFESFNNIGDPSLPHVFYDGARGGLAATLVTRRFQQQMLRNLIARIADEFLKRTPADEPQLATGKPASFSQVPGYQHYVALKRKRPSNN
jgi:hypothetical protein